jgi:hypothetical protein
MNGLPTSLVLCRADGKIFVEAERARLTRQLAKMKEEDGKVGGLLHGIYNQSA